MVTWDNLRKEFDLSEEDEKIIELEMNLTNWEDKDITLVEDFGKETISILIGGDKSNIESSLKDNKDL